MRRPLFIVSLGAEALAIVLMIFGLVEGIGNNPGNYLFGIGTALALCGALLFNKVLKGRK